MLADFVKALEAQVRLADKVEVVSVPGDPRTVLVKCGGQVDERKVPPPVREHDIASFPDFVRAIQDAAICPAPEIYFDLEGAQAFCDRADRRETVSLPLELGARWAALMKLSTGITMLPKEAIQFLRFEVASPSAQAVIAGLRRVDFTRTSAGKSDVQHGRESLGRSVEAAVQQADQIPEQFDLTIEPITNLGFENVQVTARVGVTLDFEQGRIHFKLLADELAVAESSLLRQFGAMLAEALPEVPAFNGVAA